MSSFPERVYEVDDYLAQSEQRISPLTPNTEKTVFWHANMRKQTDYALVYFHGFSATRREISPTCESLAERLRANLYMTRLKGHGTSVEALGKAKLEDWLYDAEEAYHIATLIGKKVIVVGNSTGATLATWLVKQKRREIIAAIFLSPNFGLLDWRSNIFKLPYADFLLHLLVGKERLMETISEDHRTYWTTRYPITSLKEMLKLVTMVNKIHPTKGISVPLYLAYCPQDEILNTKLMLKFYELADSEHKRMKVICETNDLKKHVLSGSILAPHNTSIIVDDIYDFLTRFCPEAKAGLLHRYRL